MSDDMNVIQELQHINETLLEIKGDLKSGSDTFNEHTGEIRELKTKVEIQGKFLWWAMGLSASSGLGFLLTLVTFLLTRS